MARGTTSDERREAVTLIPAADLPPEDDIEAAFDKWRDDLKSVESPGTIRAWQIPIDERGNVSTISKAQIRLGAWPIDLYNFDELCGIIIRDYMLPNNEKIIGWTKTYWEALHPYSAGGAYVNFMMDEGAERVKATYRDNYERLVTLKNMYDPTNLFRVNQNIKPTV